MGLKNKGKIKIEIIFIVNNDDSLDRQNIV